jgi:hypothetical protein
VSTASGICHTVTAICRYRGRVGTGLSVLWVTYNYNYIEELWKVHLRSGVADESVFLEDVSTLEDETTLSRNVKIRLPIDAL